jgi:serine/threonine protein kinase
MAEPNGFELRAAGRWKLLVRPDLWSGALWEQTIALVSAARSQKHPQTVRLAGAGDGSPPCFVKIYSPARGAGSIKDLFRDSKALRALKMSAALGRSGFHAPSPLAAGEERIAGRLGSAFLVTFEITGAPLPQALRDRFGGSVDISRFSTKRAWIRQLADEIRRFHDAGFVHGDLVASNIFVAFEGERPVFYLMDHDRTRCYPRVLSRLLARRNLVQLNRFDLPTISRSDRARFMRHYTGRNDRRLKRWLVRETRRRYGPSRRMLIEPKRERVADQIR